ncbi:MAG: tripartite tricarboxylate transporter TctB family protein [Hyphomicrobiaceae bacterium]
MPSETRTDYGGAIVAVLLIAFGAFAIYDTSTYADPDSAVFPRTVAMGLIAASASFLLMWLIGRAGPANVNERGSSLRRIAFVTVMLAAVLAMPWIGFIPAALVSFMLLMLIAMFDAWTPKRIVIYSAVGIAVVFCFYTLFAKFLQVPLPKGWLFQG